MVIMVVNKYNLCSVRIQVGLYVHLSCASLFQKLSINGDAEVIVELLARGVKPSYPQHNAAHPLDIPSHKI